MIEKPVIMAAFLTMAMISSKEQVSPRDGWDFAFKGFVIAAWNPPAATDAEYEVYREARFNLVMSPRYPLPDKALELAQKHGLRVLVDTYTPNDKHWGGTAGKYIPHPTHHPATLPELKWLHERYGHHPALAGYLLGDDYGSLPQELIDTTRFLRENAPHLFPWVCQNVMSAESLARAGNPIMDPQIYPTLYQKNLTAEKQCQLFCEAVQKLSQDCIRYDLIPWPMFNVCGVESDSLIRFQVYASLAYGAQGIWYFTYSGGLQQGAGYQTVEQVRENLVPTWKIAAEANHQAAAWGERLLGRTSAEVFHTGWLPSHAVSPAEGELIVEMSHNLLVGILTKPGEPPIAMVVNKRVDKRFGIVSEREVVVRFADAVTEIGVPEGERTRSVAENLIKLKLPAGGGQLLILKGSGLQKLCGGIK